MSLAEHRLSDTLAQTAGQCGPSPCYVQGVPAVWLADRLRALRLRQALRMRDVPAYGAKIDPGPSLAAYDTWESTGNRRRPTPFHTLKVLSRVFETTVHGLLHGLPYAEDAYVVWTQGTDRRDWIGWCTSYETAYATLVHVGIPVKRPPARDLRRGGAITLPAEPWYRRRQRASDAPHRTFPKPLASPLSPSQLRQMPLISQVPLLWRLEFPKSPTPSPSRSAYPATPPLPVEGYNAERRARGVWQLRCRSCGTPHEQPLGQRAPRLCGACQSPLSARAS